MTCPVLVGCEESQKVCAAFRARGIHSYSCDIQDTRGNPEWHMKMCVTKAIRSRKWSAIILHPDCTAMGVCGNGTYGTGKAKHHMRLEAVEWTVELWKLATENCSRVVLENPQSVIFPHLRRLGADVQYIQPWEHGHPETKKTGLALHGLQRIFISNDVSKQMEGMTPYQKHRVWYQGSKNKNRSRDRSETYQGVANALAKQIGDQL